MRTGTIFRDTAEGSCSMARARYGERWLAACGLPMQMAVQKAAQECKVDA